MSEEEKILLRETKESTRKHLENNYHPGFGIFPSESKQGNFYNQVYARDLSHAAGDYFAEINPDALEDSFNTILKHQKPNGELPLRVEWEYQQLKLWPWLHNLAKPLFDLIENKTTKEKGHPIFEGGDLGASGSEDTVPSIIIAIGEFFIASEKGKKFAKENFGKIEEAISFFRNKIDKNDKLVVTTLNNPDWADSLKRKGKLGGINISWARSLRVMEFIAKQLGDEQNAQKYEEEFKKVKESVLKKVYNKEEGYFRAKVGEDRLDTIASVSGALYLLGPEEVAQVEETLKKRVGRSSGLLNFDPPYGPREIFWGHRFMGKLTKVKNVFSGKKEKGFDAYHNEFVWPWVTCRNIKVKIKIALEHKNEIVRAQYKKESVKDLLQMAKLFKQLGGFYEVVNPDKPEPENMAFYRASKNFMWSLAEYHGVHQQLEKLGWI
jgi:hypothetical protein